MHMQLYAVEANATILLFADVRIAVTRTTRAWRNLPRIRCGSSRVVPQQARCLSAYGGTLGGPRCIGREMIALHRLMLEDGLPRRGSCSGDTRNWYVIPDSGKLGATLAHCVMIGPDRSVTNQIRSYFWRGPPTLRQPWPVPGPQVLPPGSVGHTPCAPRTAHRTPARVAECCSLEGFAPRVETAGAGQGGAKACAKHQRRPMCTAQPTLLDMSVCWFDLGLGFPVYDQAGARQHTRPHSVLSLPPEYGSTTGIDEDLRCKPSAPACRDHLFLIEGETASDERYPSERPGLWP